jgi:hypothetical protein
MVWVHPKIAKTISSTRGALLGVGSQATKQGILFLEFPPQKARPLFFQKTTFICK